MGQSDPISQHQVGIACPANIIISRCAHAVLLPFCVKLDDWKAHPPSQTYPDDRKPAAASGPSERCQMRTSRFIGNTDAVPTNRPIEGRFEMIQSPRGTGYLGRNKPRGAGRSRKTSPCYSRQSETSASVFSVSSVWIVPQVQLSTELDRANFVWGPQSENR